nr:Ger(x)C family spore germination protein [Cohnella sp. YIM B05605]
MTGNRWRRTACRIFPLLISFPLLGGCWDRLELEERAVILGVAVDDAESGPAEEGDVTHMPDFEPAPEQPMYRLTVQIALPGRIPLGPGGGGGGGGGTSKPSETVWIVGVTGHTIDDAMMNLQQKLSAPLFLGHLRVIVVSEKIARRGFSNLNDYLRRNPEVRRMAWMMISAGKAEEVIRTHPPLERVPTMYVISTLDNAARTGKFPQTFAGMFWSNSSKKGQEGVLPYVRLKEEQTLEIAGLAMFRSDRMVASSSPLQIAAYMGIKHINPGGYRGIVQIGGDSLTIYSTHRSSKIRVRIRDGQPAFTVDIGIEANVEEKSNESVSLSNETILRELEKIGGQSTQELYQGLVEKTQQYGSDIFGFGEYVRAKKPGFWNAQVKTKEKWQRMYKEASIDVNLKIHIRRIGMKAE